MSGFLSLLGEELLQQAAKGTTDIVCLPTFYKTRKSRRHPKLGTQSSALSFRAASAASGQLDVTQILASLALLLEVFVGGRRETLVSLAFCRGP